jgi:2-polyprenyl-3-methyl-5-hydroxy-6-metoxy-1,4-benzoquinol methylase
MQSCFLCNGPANQILSARDYARPEDLTQYELVWCSSCKFGRVAGKFLPSEISKFYVRDYYTHTAAWRVHRKPNILERIRGHFAWRLDNGTHLTPHEMAPVASVCDIGCGNGHDLRLFKETGASTIGVDPDPLARQAAADAGQIFEGTAEQLPDGIANKQFDAVLMMHVLEHCVDPSRAINNASSLLSDHGTLVIEVPNNEAIGFQMFNEVWPWTDIPRHLNFFTEDSLVKLLANQGFKVRKVHHVGFSRQFSNEWISMQVDIGSGLPDSTRRNFDFAAWTLLARSGFAKPSRKYDSIRVHAQRVCSD